MTKTEYLLTCLIEECTEVQQAATKCLRFGLNNYHPDHPEATNVEDLERELIHIYAVRFMLGYEGIISGDPIMTEQITPKVEKVLRFMEVSRSEGRLDPEA